MNAAKKEEIIKTFVCRIVSVVTSHIQIPFLPPASKMSVDECHCIHDNSSQSSILKLNAHAILKQLMCKKTITVKIWTKFLPQTQKLPPSYFISMTHKE